MREETKFFVFDGWFGWDKIGHFTRHVLVVSFLAWVWPWVVGPGGYMGLWAIVLIDTVLDLFYEYMNYRAWIGFSIMDVVYGRAGMLITLGIGFWANVIR